VSLLLFFLSLPALPGKLLFASLDAERPLFALLNCLPFLSLSGCSYPASLLAPTPATIAAAVKPLPFWEIRLDAALSI
jgi:hypothetical protein